MLRLFPDAGVAVRSLARLGVSVTRESPRLLVDRVFDDPSAYTAPEAVVDGSTEVGLDDALATYTILTVGDGLVTMIPSLLVSVAGGIVIFSGGAKKDNVVPLKAATAREAAASTVRAASPLLRLIVVTRRPCRSTGL